MHGEILIKTRKYPRLLVLFQLLYCSILRYFLDFEYHVRRLENLIKLSFRFKFFSLRAGACLTAFETCRKLDSVFCNYLHFSLMSQKNKKLKKKFLVY